MTVTSGRKCCELLKNSSHVGLLAKMCLESSIWHSTRCFLTWKAKVTKHNALLFQLAVSMPHTKEKESVLWPTPSNGAALCGGTGAFKTLKKMAEKGLITEEERIQFSQGNGGKTNPELLEWLMGYEQAFTTLIPTPTQTDYKGGITKRFYGGGLRTSVEKFPGMHSAWENWPDEPGIDRVVDGLPHRVDRIGCLGNAVVPQQFYPFFAAIAKIESEE